MNSLQIFLLIFLTIFIMQILLIIFEIWYIKKQEKKNNFEISNNSSKTYINIDVNTCAQLKKFLFDLIENKFKYYLYKDILPLYVNSKKLDKKQINEIKEKIFIEIRISLSKNIKQKLLSCFTKDGLNLLINEQIIILMNKIDLKFFDKDFNEDIRIL